jgi:hypothetical protein
VALRFLLVLAVFLAGDRGGLLTAGWVIVMELLTVVVFTTHDVVWAVMVGVVVMLKVMVGVILHLRQLSRTIAKSQ